MQQIHIWFVHTELYTVYNVRVERKMRAHTKSDTHHQPYSLRINAIAEQDCSRPEHQNSLIEQVGSCFMKKKIKKKVLFLPNHQHYVLKGHIRCMLQLIYRLAYTCSSTVRIVLIYSSYTVTYSVLQCSTTQYYVLHCTTMWQYVVLVMVQCSTVLHCSTLYPMYTMQCILCMSLNETQQ